MAVVSKEDIMKQVKELLKDNTTDEAIKFIEDVSDTLESLGESGKVDELNAKVAELEEKVKKTDEDWRTKYTERFYSGTDDKNKLDDPSINTPNTVDDTDDTKPQSFEDLFGEKKGE